MDSDHKKKNNSDYKKKNKISRYHLTFTRHFVFSHEIVVAKINVIFINFNDTLVSSTHKLPVNIFNLQGGEIMLAWDKENFRTPGENCQTHDPPNTTCLSNVTTTEPEGREFDSCLGHGNFLCPGRAWFLLLPS